PTATRSVHDRPAPAGLSTVSPGGHSYSAASQPRISIARPRTLETQKLFASGLTPKPGALDAAQKKAILQFPSYSYPPKEPVRQALLRPGQETRISPCGPGSHQAPGRAWPRIQWISRAGSL